MELCCKCSSSSLFITTRVPNTFHGYQTHQGRWTFKRYAKRVFFKDGFGMGYFAPKKRLLGPVNWCKVH